MRFAIPLCRSFFFVAWPLMVLWDEIGLCRKSIFQAPNFFFRTCLDCFQPLQNQYVGRHGDLKKLFSPITWRKLRLCGKTIFQAPKNCFIRTCLDCFQYWQIDVLPDLPGFEPSTFKAEVRHAEHCATGVFILILWNSDKPGFAKKNQALIFFRTALMKLRWARLCKKQLSRL